MTADIAVPHYPRTNEFALSSPLLPFHAPCTDTTLTTNFEPSSYLLDYSWLWSPSLVTDKPCLDVKDDHDDVIEVSPSPPLTPQVPLISLPMISVYAEDIAIDEKVTGTTAATRRICATNRKRKSPEPLPRQTGASTATISVNTGNGTIAGGNWTQIPSTQQYYADAESSDQDDVSRNEREVSPHRVGFEYCFANNYLADPNQLAALLRASFLHASPSPAASTSGLNTCGATVITTTARSVSTPNGSSIDHIGSPRVPRRSQSVSPPSVPHSVQRLNCDSMIEGPTAKNGRHRYGNACSGVIPTSSVVSVTGQYLGTASPPVPIPTERPMCVVQRSAQPNVFLPSGSSGANIATNSKNRLGGIHKPKQIEFIKSMVGLWDSDDDDEEDSDRLGRGVASGSGGVKSRGIARKASFCSARKGQRLKVGSYKRRRLIQLLGDATNHIHITEVVAWPEINTVYCCDDWKKLKLYDSDLVVNEEHALKKYPNFSQGSYTQSQLTLNNVQFNLRQSRCNGIRLCTICKTMLPCRSSRWKCDQPKCDGTIERVQCFVTLYYLFPAEPTHRQRFLVCLADDGHDGHSHEQSVTPFEQKAGRIFAARPAPKYCNTRPAPKCTDSLLTSSHGGDTDSWEPESGGIGPLICDSSSSSDSSPMSLMPWYAANSSLRSPPWAAFFSSLHSGCAAIPGTDTVAAPAFAASVPTPLRRPSCIPIPLHVPAGIGLSQYAAPVAAAVPFWSTID